jgi:hypothetical protein
MFAEFAVGRGQQDSERVEEPWLRYNGGPGDAHDDGNRGISTKIVLGYAQIILQNERIRRSEDEQRRRAVCAEQDGFGEDGVDGVDVDAGYGANTNLEGDGAA